MAVAYEGKEPYVFISYSHKDSAVVLPIIDILQQAGYLVWFDGGIEAGSEWPQYIADHIDHCGCLLNFVSKAYEESFHCRSEMVYAIDKKKPFLSVYLLDDDNDLPGGLRMQLGLNQAIWRKNFPTLQALGEAICRSKLLAECRGTSASFADEPTVLAEEPVKEPEPTPKLSPVSPEPVPKKKKSAKGDMWGDYGGSGIEASANRKKSKKGLIVGLISGVLVCAAAVCGYLYWRSNYNSSDSVHYGKDVVFNPSPFTPADDLTPDNAQSISINDMQIILTTDFEEEFSELNALGVYSACYSTEGTGSTLDDISVFFLYEPFSKFTDIPDMTLADYADLVYMANITKLPDEVTQIDELTVMEYSYYDETEEVMYRYFCSMYEGSDGYWLIQFCVEESLYDTYRQQFIDWAKTVSFSAYRLSDIETETGA